MSSNKNIERIENIYVQYFVKLQFIKTTNVQSKEKTFVFHNSL